MSRMTGKSVVAAQNEQEYHGTFTEEEKIRLNELVSYLSIMYMFITQHSYLIYNDI